MSLVYPEARRDETVVDNYFGVDVKDPYRWLEDPDSSETKKFVDDQNNVTTPYIEGTINLFYRMKSTWIFYRFSTSFCCS